MKSNGKTKQQVKTEKKIIMKKHFPRNDHPLSAASIDF